jgi:hypothetical protein
MPYINQESRNMLASDIAGLCVTIDAVMSKDGSTARAGTLNYVVSTLLDLYYPDGSKYDDYNSAVGVLECIKLELYRRIVGKYEDLKIVQNGDVYRVKQEVKENREGGCCGS